MKLSVVIPCYNEADGVQALVESLVPVVEGLRREQDVEILFVDDGSTDGTGDLLEAAFAAVSETRVVRHERNRGLGAAVRTGFANARGEVVVNTDSDATYPFELIPKLLACLRPGVDLVTASCYHPLGGIENVPGYRVFLSKGASLLYRLLLDRHIHTYTCLFRAYRRHVIETVPFESDGFLGVTEILANSIRQGYRVAELPCVLRSRRFGLSKARVIPIIRSHLGFQMHLLFSRSVPAKARASSSA
jgi:dolichol-phosphate mannosyltransferase